jgi:protein-S-isoprenylcysteine O-methyltransferase Ste14
VVSFLFPFAWAFLPVTVAGMLVFVFGFLWTQWAKSVLAFSWSAGNVITTSHELSREMPYSLVRHPFYFGVIIMLSGTALVFGNLTMMAATVVAIMLLLFNAMMEENMLKEEFGQEYSEYQEEVPFFVPRLVGSFTKAFSRKEDDEL